MLDSRVSSDIKLKPGTTASNFTDMGKADDIHSCIGRCCPRPSCDIAYLLNEKCFAVQCLDGVLCQTSAEPAASGANVKLAYMNRESSGQKQKGQWYMSYGVSSLLYFCFTKWYPVRSYQRQL